MSSQGNDQFNWSSNETIVTTTSSPTCDDQACAVKVKVYRRRWLMLVMFVLFYMLNAFQWIHFSIINNLIVKYYGVESQAVDWTSLLFMVVYFVLIIPGAWIIDKVGLRNAMLSGSIATTLAAWINVMGVAPDRFYVVLIGQTVSSIGQVFVLSMSPNVAAAWFGPDQVSLACSIGVFGSQIGIALGLLIPPIIVQDHDNSLDIGTDLKLLLYIVAGISSILLLPVIFVFQAKPPLPPSGAQVLAAKETIPTIQNFFQSGIKAIIDRGFFLLVITYGINVGVFYAMSILMNQTILLHFPNEGKTAGQIGLVMVMSGMVGSVVFGAVLDKTHKFKETTLVTYFFALVGMVAYTFTFYFEYIPITFITVSIAGFFMTGYLPVGFEFGVEITYPEPEVISTGFLNASAQIFGIFFTLLGGWLLGNFGSVVCNGLLSAALLIGLVLTIPIRSELKRQKANQEASNIGIVKEVPLPIAR